MASSTDLGLLGRVFESHRLPKMFFLDVSHVDLENDLSQVYPGNRTLLDIDTSTRISGRLASPRFRGEGVINLSLGRPLGDRLQVFNVLIPLKSSTLS